MKFINKVVIIVAILALPSMSFGQNCNHFHEEYCYASDNRAYKLNGQSKSSIFGKGQSSELNILVYKKMDYRISICTTENLGNDIFFKIYEVNNVRIKRMIDGNPIVTMEKRKELLYDNSEYEYATEIEFSAESTRRLIVEIAVPGEEIVASTSKAKSKLLRKSKIGCIGVLIEHMTTPTSGF